MSENKSSTGTSTPSPDTASAAGSARTDDLLASGAEAKDGARGFEKKLDPEALQTGMEGIADAGTGKAGAQKPG